MLIADLEEKPSMKSAVANLIRKSRKHHFIRGIRVLCSGRIGGVSKAKQVNARFGATALQDFSAKIDYANLSMATRFGSIGIRVWVKY
jgi:small subunit ribosomal protein S3